MSSLRNIAEGWFNMAMDRHRELALSRLEKCDSCPYKTQMNMAGQVIVSTINHKNSIYYCASCGCPLEPKTRVPSERCPEGNWNSVEIEDESYY
jgi:hypothetical protein